MLLEVVRRHQNVDPGHMLGLEDAVTVLRHVHINADLLWPAQLLDQYQLTSLSVWTLHDEDPSGVSAHYAKAQAVRARASGCSRGSHSKKRGRGLQVGGQRQVVEGHGLWSQVAGAAVHWAGVSLTLTARQKCSNFKPGAITGQGGKLFPCVKELSWRTCYIINPSPWESAQKWHIYTQYIWGQVSWSTESWLDYCFFLLWVE